MKRFGLAAILVVLAGCGPHRPARSGAAKALDASAVLVDKVVAVVDERPITCSEVELEARIHKAAEGDCAAAMGDIAREDMVEMLQALIDRSLILRQMQRENADHIVDGQVTADVTRIRDACVTREAFAALLTRLELSEAEVTFRRRQTLDANRFISLRLARAWQLRRRSRGSSDPLATSEREQKQALLEEILAALRQPARRVRVIDDLARGAPGVETDSDDHC